MSAIHPDIESLLDRISRHGDSDLSAPSVPHLSLTVIGDLFDLDFYGDPAGEAFGELSETLSKPGVATALRGLNLRSPDEGANGTKNWDLSPLVGKNAIFPCLKSFTIQQALPSDHNRSIVGASYDENGVLARLLRQSPTLQHLTIPSAPNADFFEVVTRPIQFLSVDAGYDTQGFISNLSESRSFPDLRCLEWGEYNETHMENWQANSTPFTDYERLFRSTAFLGVKRFVWRNPLFSKGKIQELKGNRPGLQMLIVRIASENA